MELRITEFKLNEQRPQVEMPGSAMLDHLKEEGIRKMINDHYDLLIKSNVKHLFPDEGSDLQLAKQYAADFFIQVLGGYPHYQKNRGNPKLVIRHQPFTITPEARYTWLDCYRQILPKLEVPEDEIMKFWNYLEVFSKWMVNAIKKG